MTATDACSARSSRGVDRPHRTYTTIGGGWRCQYCDVHGDPPPRTRTGDPETSHMAEESIRPQIRESQAYVLSLFHPRRGPTTDQDLVSISKLSPSGTRTRRSELVTLGLVEWTGELVTLPTGRKARLWRRR